MEPRKFRYRARVAAGVVAAATVARTGPDPGRADLVRRRPRRPKCTTGRRGAGGARAALADKATLNALMGATDSMEQAHEALAIAREVDDPALLLRALTACGGIAVYDPEVARPYFAEAIGLARTIGDGLRLSQILNWQAFGGVMVGDPIAIRAAAEEGRDLADAIGDRFASHGCRWSLGIAQGMTGDLAGAVAQLREVIAEADAAHDGYWRCCALFMQAFMLAYHGDLNAARQTANSAVEAAAELGEFFPGLAYAGLTVATLAAGDVAAANDAIAAGLPHLSLQPKQAAIWIALRGPGRVGAWGSDRGPAPGRRRRRGDERLSPVASADDARGRCDRAG